MKGISAGELRTSPKGVIFAVLEETRFERDYKLMRIPDGWTFIAHGCSWDEHGNIGWEYSTGGYFPQGSEWNRGAEETE